MPVIVNPDMRKTTGVQRFVVAVFDCRVGDRLKTSADEPVFLLTKHYISP